MRFLEIKKRSHDRLSVFFVAVTVLYFMIHGLEQRIGVIFQTKWKSNDRMRMSHVMNEVDYFNHFKIQ